ncbi:maleylpyruvate isomerase family mycothiol-dependent enzyme [Streptomyces sp. NPDC001941]|uniref:maleylpyruvate isomerase family mycothiol-dependent enzyme n=1 Tax=Streptomyces sp. NPDC001941 TaxID=3154659 RepID=UPI0033276E52
MNNPDRDRVWALVHAERAVLIDDLGRLGEDAWRTPSLCDGWTVHDVAAHLVDTAKTTRTGFVLALALARFDFDRQNAAGVARERGATPARTLEGLRRVAHRTSTPPAPLDSRLVEEVVHGEDVRRPLGLRRAYPREVVERALRHQTRTPAAFGGAKELLGRVRLTAADTGLVLGSGPAVTGPALSLLLAVSGRRAALEDLSGPGVGVLGGEG